MIVYHGGNMEVREPKLIRPIWTLDFGPGFYTTLNQNQAIEFARKVVDRVAGRGIATLNRYSSDEKAAFACGDTIRVARYNVYDYIRKYFGAFHTMGEKLVFDDIDACIARQAA